MMTTLHAEEIILLPTYIERKAVRITVPSVPLDLYLWLFLTCICTDGGKYLLGVKILRREN